MKKRTVFFVDDERGILDVYEGALSQQFDLKSFLSPIEMIAEVEKGHYADVYVTDMKMPGMDGIQLIKWARSRKIDKPFIIISGYSEKADAVSALKLGVVDLVEKPFALDHLINVIRKASLYSVYQHIQTDLMTTYRELTQSLVELARNYESRSLAVEDELYRLNLLPGMEKDKIDQLMKSVRESVVLEQVVGMAQKNLRKLTNLEDELKAILSVYEA